MRGMSGVSKSRRRLLQPLLLLICCAGGSGHGLGADGRVAEHVTLTNGFDLICDHREQSGDRVRLYTEAGSSNFVEVSATEVASVEQILLPTATVTAPIGGRSSQSALHADLTQAELHELLSSAGVRHNLDVNLLASLVQAESGGHTRAISKKGAQGLMQLMPTTAAQLGVNDSLRPEENVAGGTTYLDSLLTRYHDNLALALAAYNAGPAAVDRWHGVPPYRETRLYVARIIRDFNASVRNAARVSHPDPHSRGAVAETNPAQAGMTGAIAP
jgi:Transglycosylase SLT domain